MQNTVTISANMGQWLKIIQRNLYFKIIIGIEIKLAICVNLYNVTKVTDFEPND